MLANTKVLLHRATSASDHGPSLFTRVGLHTAWPRLTGHWPHTRQFERIARGLYLAMCATHLVLFLPRTRYVDDRMLVTWIATLFLISGIATLRRSANLLGVGSMVVATALALRLPGEVQESVQGAPGFLLAWVIALLLRPAPMAVAVAGAALGSVGVVRFVRFGAANGWSALDDMVICLVFSIAVSVIRDAGLEGVMSADRSHSDMVRDDLRERLAAAEAHAVRAAHETLHDDALGVLAAVGSARDDDPALLRRIHDVATRLEGRTARGPHDRSTALAEVLDDLARESVLHVSFAAGRSRSATWPALDDTQVGIVRRAVSEALRNVERHAGVEDASIRADFDGGWFSVEVRDDGRGFDPQGGQKWGRRHSIEEPVGSIEGRVRTWSKPGAGTTVVISWPAQRDRSETVGHLERVDRATRFAAPGSIQVVLGALLWVLSGHAYLAVRYTWGRPAALWQLVDAAALVALTVYGVRRLRVGPLPLAVRVGTSLATAFCVGAGLALAGPGSLHFYESFIVGMSCILLTATAFFSDGLATTLTTTPTIAVLVVATLVDPFVGWADSLGAYAAIVMPVLGAFAIGAFLRRVSHHTDTDARRFAELSGAAYRVRAEQAARRQLTPFTRDTVAPWMHAVAQGIVPLGSPATRAESAELARQVRDELYLGGALDNALRGRIAHARSTDIRVEFEAKEGDVLPDAVITLRLLDRLLDDTTGVNAIHVAVPTHADPMWKVSIVPGLTSAALDRLNGPLSTVQHRVVNGRFATTLTGVIGHMPDGEPVSTRDSMPG